MIANRRCRACGGPLRNDAKFCTVCGVATEAEPDSLDSLGKLAGDAFKRIEKVTEGVVGGLDEPRAASGEMVRGPHTASFQSREECEQWKSQMGSRIQILSVARTYTVTYQPTPPPSPPPQAAPTASNVSQPAPQESPQRPAASDDVTEKIRKLAELKDSGILTEEEFQSKKKELLSEL
jgi:hypothetical protein